MILRPRLITVSPNRELRRIRHLLLPGIFDGDHDFQIVPLTGDRVKFVQGEKFSGILAWTAKSGRSVS
jgi:hypothetical protein